MWPIRFPAKAGVLCGMLVIAAVLLFARLGHYALWNDEAGTALSAKSVLRTGDTGAFADDHNIIAFWHGSELKDLKLRYVPPGQAYLTAPFLAWLGRESALAARLPFALCGLAGIALVLGWLWREQAGWAFLALVGTGTITNVSLLLYARQCRYYAPAMLCSIAIAYAYRHRGRQRGWAAGMAFFFAGLLTLSYLSYAALGACLVVDYALWGRREQRIAPRDWLRLILPQAVVIALIVPVWNQSAGQAHALLDMGHFSWCKDKLALLWCNLRDLNRCEFGALALLALAPCLYPVNRNVWLLRAPLALLVYLLVIVAALAQVGSKGALADVRYLVAIIPLCVVVEALVIGEVVRARLWLALPLGAVVFFTNLAHGGWWFPVGVRSTFACYLGELRHPPGDPYTVTARWINANVPAGGSIWVVPGYAAYPLMFHAPKAVYAWQLVDPPAAQFAGLPSIHFVGREAPDYAIAFGPQGLDMVRQMIWNWDRTDVEFVMLGTLNFFWRDMYRPELFWRTFEPVTHYDHEHEAIYIFKIRRV